MYATNAFYTELYFFFNLMTLIVINGYSIKKASYLCWSRKVKMLECNSTSHFKIESGNPEKSPFSRYSPKLTAMSQLTLGKMYTLQRIPKPGCCIYYNFQQISTTLIRPKTMQIYCSETEKKLSSVQDS